ncbi:MAG: DNA polymerase III subunit chi, partial [Pseudomonadota bacterium]|nr:DNA polymerase III subunit chi [Pseudomonadota bacterium]
ASEQPVWLTADDERPNDAAVLFLTDGAESALVPEYTRVCEIFDGNDEASLASARRRWASYKSAGHALSYWQQGERGWIDQTPKG